jgi:hypothetical protein
MRLSVLSVPLLLVSIPAAAADPIPARNMPVIAPGSSSDGKCPPISPYHAMKDKEKLMTRKLTELPPALHYKAAYRRINGCEVPIVAGFGVRQPKR